MSNSHLPFGVQNFLEKNPSMGLQPITTDEIVIKGCYHFNLAPRDLEALYGSYQLMIKIGSAYPRETPNIWELEKTIPRVPDYHINPDDSFCLGSPLRLKTVLHHNSDFQDFVEEYLDPYLYAATYKLKHGGSFVFGELEHGKEGELADYRDLFGVKNSSSVIKSLRALSEKKRIANKRPCPCDCKNRLGVCNLHHVINRHRNVVPRCDYAARHKALAT